MSYVENIALIREMTRILTWCRNSIGQNIPCETHAQVCDITIDVRGDTREGSGLNLTGSSHIK
jgi:hypothetical protein